MTRPAPTLLVLVGVPGDGLALLTEMARALGHQIAPTGPDSSRLGGWFGTGDRVVVVEPRLAERWDAYLAAADRLGAAVPVVVVLERPADVPDVPAWLDATLGAVTVTRGQPRAVVRAEDLLDDWQSSLSRVDKECGSRLLTAATLAQLDDADDVVRGWRAPAGHEWPAGYDPVLRDLAARAWAAIASVADGRGDLDFLDVLWTEHLRTGTA